MNSPKKRNTVLALTGMVALAIYILACTSFSPDDKKVLYPAFDPASGRIALATYDRETRRSDLLFVPFAYETNSAKIDKQAFLRGQWLADGRNIVVAWAFDGGSESDVLSCAVLPAAGKGPVKTFRLEGIKEAGMNFMFPLCLAGDRLLVRAKDRSVACLDLKTGVSVVHELKEVDEPTLLGAVEPNTAFYVSEDKGSKSLVFGRLDAETFATTPLLTCTNSSQDRSFFAYDPQGKAIAFLGKEGTNEAVVVVRQGKGEIRRALPPGPGEREIMNAVFFPKGDALGATYVKTEPGKEATEFGFMRIPLDGGAIREKTLFVTPDRRSGKDAEGMFWQGALSHDGKTAAIASTYLACDAEKFKPEDCALFLIDLSKSDWPVEKVAIPVPAKRP